MILSKISLPKDKDRANDDHEEMRYVARSQCVFYNVQSLMNPSNEVDTLWHALHILMNSVTYKNMHIHNTHMWLK